LTQLKFVFQFQIFKATDAQQLMPLSLPCSPIQISNRFRFSVAFFSELLFINPLWKRCPNY